MDEARTNILVHRCQSPTLSPKQTRISTCLKKPRSQLSKPVSGVSLFFQPSHSPIPPSTLQCPASLHPGHLLRNPASLFSCEDQHRSMVPSPPTARPLPGWLCSQQPLGSSCAGPPTHIYLGAWEEPASAQRPKMSRLVPFTVGELQQKCSEVFSC